MKMFKKIMAVALTAVMAVSMLTGCAVTNAIAEDKAQSALENAWKTVKNVEVTFKDLNVNSSVTSPVKTAIKDGTIKLKDNEAAVRTVTEEGKIYTIVVVTEPKSATKYENWKNLAKKVLDVAGWDKGVYLDGATNKKAKVDVIVDLEGKDATDSNKKDTYAMFVFAANDKAYGKN